MDDATPGGISAGGPAPGPVVVITGASSGIGRCTALLFAEHGWKVGLIARGEAGLRSIESELPVGRAAFAVADVAQSAALEAAAASIEAALGPIDAWINCAGNGVFSRFLGVPEAEFTRVTDVTYMGTVNGTRVALARMLPRDAGSVVNICSAIAFHGLPMLSSYSGAKSAVKGFTESVGHELAEEASRVHLGIVYPPAVNTPFFSHAGSHMHRPPRPARPVYQPEIVARAILHTVLTRRAEMKVSGTTTLFALACRLVPRLVHRAIQRLGSAGQMTTDPAAALLRETTLFAPSLSPGRTHGPFGRGARRSSLQVWAQISVARLFGRQAAAPEATPAEKALEAVLVK